MWGMCDVGGPVCWVCVVCQKPLLRSGVRSDGYGVQGAGVGVCDGECAMWGMCDAGGPVRWLAGLVDFWFRQPPLGRGISSISDRWVNLICKLTPGFSRGRAGFRQARGGGQGSLPASCELLPASCFM